MRSNKRIRAATLLIALSLCHPAASACGGDYNSVGFLHTSLPDDVEYEVAAQVEITALTATTFPGEAEGRILSMIRGNYSGAKVVIRNLGGTSCDSFPMPGQKGIVLGRTISSSDDALVIDPIRTLSERQILLKAGKLPE